MKSCSRASIGSRPSSSSSIQAGQSLTVSGRTTSTKSAPVQTAKAAPAPAPVLQRAAKPSAPVPSDGRYRIRSGDTLGHIAEMYGVRASDLRRWNNMRGSRISAGKYLRVRPPSASAPVRASAAASSSSGGQRYRIRSGDTLELIAKRFNCSISDLKAWNGLRSTRIRAGAYLTVKPGNSSGGAE